jgi:hypothetical protein
LRRSRPVDLAGGASKSHNSQRGGMKTDVPEILVSISVHASQIKGAPTAVRWARAGC